VAGKARSLTPAVASHLVAQFASEPLVALGFKRDGTVRYVREVADVRQTVEVLGEPGRGGAAKIRIHFGVTPAGGLATVLHGWEDLPGAEHAAINGDLGSLAFRRKRHLWLTVGEKTSALPWRQVSTVEEVGGRFRQLIDMHLAPLMARLPSLDEATDWIRENGEMLKRAEVWPWTEEMQSRTLIAFTILTGHHDAALSLLTEWNHKWGSGEFRESQFARFQAALGAG
jgi:hypothetical protein